MVPEEVQQTLAELLDLAALLVRAHELHRCAMRIAERSAPRHRIHSVSETLTELLLGGLEYRRELRDLLLGAQRRVSLVLCVLGRQSTPRAGW